MRLNTVLRAANNYSALESFKKSVQLHLADAPVYLKSLKDANKTVVYQKINDLNNWYTRLLGLDEVRAYQNRVSSLQDQLLETQEKRREIGRQLADVRQKSNELQDEIHKVKRQEDLQKFLDLMKEESEILKLESTVSKTFQDYDQTERELFTAFTNAIRDSHEKQRAQVEYTKYFGLVLSITGSFLAFCYSTLKKQDLKRFVEEKLSDVDKANEPILSLIKSNEGILREILQMHENFSPTVVHHVETPADNVQTSDNYQVYKTVGYLCLIYGVLKIVSNLY